MNRPWEIGTRLTLVLFALISLLTVGQYGITYDEPFQMWCGNAAIRYYLSGFQDHGYLDFTNCWFYGATFDYVASFFRLFFHDIDIYLVRHIATLFFSMLGVLYAVRLSKLFSGSRAGFFTAVFLVLTPAYYGHSFFNNKDIPFAALYIISIYYIVVYFQNITKPSLFLLLKLGIALGASIGIRVGGVALVITFIVSNFIEYGKINRQRLVFICLVGVVTWVTAMFVWPTMMHAPFTGIFKAIKEASHFSWYGQVHFQGKFFRSDELPKTYLPIWILSTLPEFYFLVFIGAIRKYRFDFSSPKTLSWMVLLFAALLPVVLAFVQNVILYDGWRHFLFLAPPMALVAACLLDSTLKKISIPWVSYALASAIAVSIVRTIYDLYSLHPYQYIFFNRAFAGGQKAGVENFEGDYWGLSYREAMEWVSEHVSPKDQKICLNNCSLADLTNHAISQIPGAEKHFGVCEPHSIFMATTRDHCHLKEKGEVLHVIKRKDAEILYIRKSN